MKIAKTYILLILGATQILISCTSNKFEEKSPLKIENKNSELFNISKENDPTENDLETHSAEKNSDFNFDTQAKFFLGKSYRKVPYRQRG